MKKIYLILPLLILLTIIVVAACNILVSTQNEVADEAFSVKDDLPSKTVPEGDNIITEIPPAPAIDMSDYNKKSGLPAPHGSVHDSYRIAALKPSDVDETIVFIYE